MGCGPSKPAEDVEAIARNRAIDAQLSKDRQASSREIKMLLLGTGESGKSTVMKQMVILHKGGFAPDEREAYIEIIYSNTVQSMQAVLDALPLLSVSLAPANQQAAYLIEDTDPDERSTDRELVNALLALASDPAVKAVLEVKERHQLNDSLDYFLEHIPRTFDPAYMPTDMDIIKARVRTTGIVENSFDIGKQRFRIFDVGGQRSERKKWIHCFEEVNVLLFLVAISEYDQMLYEDETQSRMSEALSVFESISNSRWFTNSTLILFLNKVDLFRAKLPISSLRAAFPGFTGDDLSYEDTSRFILSRFSSLYRNPRGLYHHFTDATNTQSLSVIIAAVSDRIMTEMLSASGILQ